MERDPEALVNNAAGGLRLSWQQVLLLRLCSPWMPMCATGTCTSHLQRFLQASTCCECKISEISKLVQTEGAEQSTASTFEVF